VCYLADTDYGDDGRAMMPVMPPASLKIAVKTTISSIFSDVW